MNLYSFLGCGVQFNDFFITKMTVLWLKMASKIEVLNKTWLCCLIITIKTTTYNITVIFYVRYTENIIWKYLSINSHFVDH